MSSLELSAKELLETGNIRLFEEFLVANSEKININYLFDDQETFLIILVQTYRNAESNLIIDRSMKLPIDDYKSCMSFLVEIGCDLNCQDCLGRTVGHWTIILQCLELLGVALRLGCNPSLQDNESQTIVHLAIRYSNTMALETIKLYSDEEEKVFECASKSSGATPLIYAVQIGATDLVKKLLQLSVNMDQQEVNRYKRTALHYALFTENIDIFELLLKQGARTDIKDYKDKNIIDHVAEHPKDNFLRTLTHYSSADLLISNEKTGSDSAGADVAGSYSPLLTACKNNDYATLCELLKKHSNLTPDLTTDPVTKRTVLHYCSDNADTACAKRIVELCPALVRDRDVNGFTPLHLAAIANNADLARLLLASSPDKSLLHDKDKDGHSCLHWSVVCCAKEVMQYLLSVAASDLLQGVDNYGATPLHYATQTFLAPSGLTDGPAILRLLTEPRHEFDIDFRDNEGRSAFLWAASLGLVDCCQLLLEMGADLCQRDRNGLTALHCAASRGNYDVVELLVTQWHFPIDCIDDNGCSSLFYAVTLQHTEIVHFLLDNGSDPNLQDVKGRSVAHCAVLKGFVSMIDLIRKKGGSLCLVNHQGELPLHESCRMGEYDVCEILLRKMFECSEISDHIDQYNHAGYTSLHLAAQYNHTKLCSLLIEYGANQTLPALHGSHETALQLATDVATIQLFSPTPHYLPSNNVVSFRRSNSFTAHSTVLLPSQLPLLAKSCPDLSSLANSVPSLSPSLLDTHKILHKRNNIHNTTKSLSSTPSIYNATPSSSGSVRNSNPPFHTPRAKHGPKKSARKHKSASKSGPQKPRDIQSRVSDSVRQYEECRKKIQDLANHRRACMYQGFSKSLERINQLNIRPHTTTKKPAKPSSNQQKHHNNISQSDNGRLILPAVYVPPPSKHKSVKYKSLERVKSAYHADNLIIL